MDRKLRSFMKYLPYIISLALFVMPFFWLKPGEMDLGGDSSRLYFYDPINYLLNHSLYGVSPSNFGGENIGYYILPFNILLILMKRIFQSPTLLISTINGINFSVAFISIYLIVKELIKASKLTVNKSIVDWSAITGGIFYTFSFNSTFGWDKVIITHNQYFLNPLMFLFLLLFITREKFIYLLLFLLTSFIFSANFSFAGAPPLFAFYPLSILFLLLFSVLILRKKFLWKKIFISVSLFIGLQAFHLIPQLYSLFSPGSLAYTSVFSSEGKIDRGLGYFSGVVTEIKLSTSILNLPQMSEFFPIYFFSILTITTIVIGIWASRSKIILLLSVFFLISLFFVTANITVLGLTFYKFLFNVPGFSMFRNFFGQWAYVFRFFYTLLFSVSLVVIFNRFKAKNIRISVCLFLIIILVINALPLIDGSRINPFLWGSKLKIVTEFDKDFEKSISFTRNLPDGKVLTLPLTDPGYQIIVGKHKGAYQGPSIVAYLAGKRDFAGLQELGSYGKPFLGAIKSNNFERANKILSLLNIKYIYHNEDPLAYEKGFPDFPYLDVRNYSPKDQEGYRKLIKFLNVRRIFSQGYYTIYELNNSLPHIYSPLVTEISNSDPSNTELFLDIYNLPEEKFATLQTGNTASNHYIEFTSVNERFLHKTDYPINTIYPFAKWSPSSMLYPIVLWREKDVINNSKDVIVKIQKQTLSALKRISELEKWGDSFSIKKNVNKENTSWAESLKRYENTIIGLYSFILNSKISDTTRLNELTSLHATIEHNKEKVALIIADSKFSRINKDILYSLADKIFDSIDKLIGKNNEGDYFYYINNENFGKSPFNVVVGNPEDSNLFESLNLNGYIFTIPPKEDKPYSEIENVTLVKGLNTVQLILSNMNNFTDHMLWFEAKDLNILNKQGAENELIFYPGTTSYIASIPKWEENKKYEITFDYNTNETPYEMSLYLKDKSGFYSDRVKHAAIFREKKNTNVWTKFRAIIESKNKIDPIFEIRPLSKSNNNKTLSIKDFKTREMPNPPAVFLKKKDNLVQKNTDKLTSKKIDPALFKVSAKLSYTKINPTYYKIKVSDITGPFSVVMLDAFNKSWILREDARILDFKADEAFQAKHTVAFGYANAWSLNEKNLDKRKTLHLVLEFKTQKYFYIGTVVSLLSLIILFGLIIKELKILNLIKKFLLIITEMWLY